MLEKILGILNGKNSIKELLSNNRGGASTKLAPPALVWRLSDFDFTYDLSSQAFTNLRYEIELINCKEHNPYAVHTFYHDTATEIAALTARTYSTEKFIKSENMGEAKGAELTQRTVWTSDRSKRRQAEQNQFDINESVQTVAEQANQYLALTQRLKCDNSIVTAAEISLYHEDREQIMLPLFEKVRLIPESVNPRLDQKFRRFASFQEGIISGLESYKMI